MSTGMTVARGIEWLVFNMAPIYSRGRAIPRPAPKRPSGHSRLAAYGCTWLGRRSALSARSFQAQDPLGCPTMGHSGAWSVEISTGNVSLWPDSAVTADGHRIL